MTRSKARLGLAALLVAVMISSIMLAINVSDTVRRIHVTAYFANTTGLFPGDEVRILGVPVGRIDTITPGSADAKVTFWFDRKYDVPADVQAAILSPALVSARVIQLTPAYTGGPVMTDEAVIPQDRTAVPVEWDDIRQQLQKLTESLQPTSPGGVSPLGALINTGADNLRGQGANVRDSFIKLSQALSALGDHSGDIFSTVKSLSVLVTALQSSTDVMAQFNGNLANVTNQIANDPNEVGRAVSDLDTAVSDVHGFLADNRETAGVSFDKLASLTTAITESLGSIKQVLHVAPNAMSNLSNAYRPAHLALAGDFVLPQMSNPMQFVCGAIQAASRLNYEQSAKLCAQYLAPIFKNRQYNLPPLGLSAFTAATARPNELTYSEEWMRPDYNFKPNAVPTPLPTADSPAETTPSALPAETSTPVDPSSGLQGMMVPPGSGS